LVLEIRGYDELADIRAQVAERWVKAVNADGRNGTWRYAMVRDPKDVSGAISAAAEVVQGLSSNAGSVRHSQTRAKPRNYIDAVSKALAHANVAVTETYLRSIGINDCHFAAFAVGVAGSYFLPDKGSPTTLELAGTDKLALPSRFVIWWSMNEEAEGATMEKETLLNIRNFGQIKEAKLSFGDLTVLVGPQATGKSISLQLLKLVIDAGQVQDELDRYGLDWAGSLPEFLDVYLGEGMRSLWRPRESVLEWNGRAVDLVGLAKRRRPYREASFFFIPAQRVLALRDGWPRPFTDYAPGDPFAVREFSENLRVLVGQEFGGSGDLFPQPKRLKEEFRDLLQRHLFSDFHLKVDKFGSQKRLVLGSGPKTRSLPYMVWSAGQREFVPLLLGLYWLMPPSRVAMRGEIRWVALEELEMGLHPRAITVVMLLVFELVTRGYRVCLSTHSPQVLDALWALKHLRETGASAEAFLKVFDAPNTQPMKKLAATVMDKVVKVFYFSRETGRSSDISELDPAAENDGESGWGGLSEFSGRANTAVARAVANAGAEEQG
jgi:hypothetical protein